MAGPIRIDVIPGEHPAALFLRAIEASAESAAEAYLRARAAGRSDFLIAVFISCAADGPDHTILLDVEDRAERARDWAETNPDALVTRVLAEPAADGYYPLLVIGLDHGYFACWQPAPSDPSAN